MITYGKQNVSKDDITKVAEILAGDWLTTGPTVDEFEKAFAKYVGAKYAVAVNSGTAALHLAYMALGLKQNDEIITSPITFAATANAALYCNAKPVFVDVNPNNGLINPSEIVAKVSRKTKIIVPVHIAGQVCNMKKIRDIAKKSGCFVVEDACQALGATHKGSKVGDCKYSDMCCFSFHPVKHITTGEGGMITTNNPEYYNTLKCMRAHGMERDKTKYEHKDEGGWWYEMHYLGYNYRITDFQCALGLAQLKRSNDFLKTRRKIAGWYEKELKGIKGIQFMKKAKDDNFSYHIGYALVKDAATRKALFDHMKAKGINCQVHHIPVYYHPYYRKLGYKGHLCPNAERFYDRVITLPLHTQLTKPEFNQVIKSINFVCCVFKTFKY